MPFKNNEYEPDKPYKRRMKRLISRYLNTPTGGCKRQEFVKLLNELQSIETDFYRQTDNSNIAKTIWKERCPRGGIIITVGRQVALVTYKTRDCTHYGHSKGKIEFNETIQECAAREAKEELGLSRDFVYNLIRDTAPIKKEVPYKIGDLTYNVDHYYFIIVLSSKKYRRLRPNRHEIDKIELRNIDTLPCYRNCSKNPPVENNEKIEEEEQRNYFMVSCANFKAATSLVWDIIKFVDARNENQIEFNRYNEKHRSCQRQNQ